MGNDEAIDRIQEALDILSADPPPDPLSDAVVTALETLALEPRVSLVTLGVWARVELPQLLPTLRRLLALECHLRRLITESDGVAGYHLNGAIALWADLEVSLFGDSPR